MPSFTSIAAHLPSRRRTTSITGQSVGDLADVDLAGIEAGKVLKFDSVAQKWVVSDDLGLTEETDPFVPKGTQAGEMQYWNGTEWEIVAPASANGQTLYFINGKPQWGPRGMCYDKRFSKRALRPILQIGQ